MKRVHRFIALLSAILLSAPGIATADGAFNLVGAFSAFVQKPNFVSSCPSGVADECGVIELAGLGTADWAYVFGPKFQPTGQKGCFNVDGTLTITLHSNGSAISGPLTGVFCSRLADPAHQRAGRISYGNPYSEDDNVQFITGTGQFSGLHGTALFHTFSAGAVFQGSLTGTLSF